MDNSLSAKQVCMLCGGNEFNVEHGFKYCTLCFTQVNEDFNFDATNKSEVADETNMPFLMARKRRAKPNVEQDPLKTYVSTLQAYNHIIYGLTRELIKLGAKETLLPLVQILWYNYLQELKLLDFMEEEDTSSKEFNFSNIVKDENPGPSTQITECLKQHTKLNRKSLVDFEHDRFIESYGEADESIGQQTLGNLSVVEHTEQHKTFKKAETNLKENKSKGNRSGGTKNSNVMVLTKLKVYSILYLALLINEDEVHLGDMIRFISEGHLSYNVVVHLVPANLRQDIDCLDLFSRTKIFLKKTMRTSTVSLGKFLRCMNLIPEPNIRDLCKRYCIELSLPDEVLRFIENILTIAPMSMKIILDSEHSKHKIAAISNYEARALSLILFVLKLLFGLDDVTEYRHSDLADNINTKLNPEERMFNFMHWLTFITYRRIVILEHHVPSQWNKDVYYPDKFTSYIKSKKNLLKRIRRSVVNKNAFNYAHLKELLNCFSTSIQTEPIEKLHFKATLTPGKDYLEVIRNAGLIESMGYNKDILEFPLEKRTLNFLLHPKEYYDQMECEVVFKHNSANSEIKINKNLFGEKLNEDMSELIGISLLINRDIEFQLKQSLNNDQNETHEMEFDICEPEDSETMVHYDSAGTVWLFRKATTTLLNDEGAEDLLKKIPLSFRLILEEFSLIAGQPICDVLNEYCAVETFLSYYINPKNRKLDYGKISDRFFAMHLRRLRMRW